MAISKGLVEANLPNTDYQDIKAKFDRLCDEQESLYKPEFKAVFNELYKLDTTLTKNNPCTKDEALLDEALRVAGFATNEGFCADFKRYNALFVDGKALQAKGLELMAKDYQNEDKQIGGWHFYPIAIIASPEIESVVDDIMQEDAKEGKGLFANITQIPDNDELLDEFLGVEAYGLKCSFVPFLDELKQYAIVDGAEPFFDMDFTRGLFAFLKEAATYIKENTDKPQAIKNEIARLVRQFDSIPIWGLFFQILFLQGLCRWLEGVSINEGDNGYKEACSLYDWLCMQLAYKEMDFCFKPYGEKDLERLEPLCAYLASTQVGQMVQNSMFGKEPQPEQTTDAQSLNKEQTAPEPQQKQPKPTRGKGRPKETLKTKMIDDANGGKLQKMHSVMKDKKGKDADVILLAAIKKGWLMKPTYTQVINEFGDIGSRTGYNKYLNEQMFTEEEIEGARNSLD